MSVENSPASSEYEVVSTDKTNEAPQESASEAAKASDETAKAEADESETSEETEENPSEESEGSENEETQPKKKNGYKKRIDKLAKRASQAEQELAYWKEQAQKGQLPKQNEEPAQGAKQAAAPAAGEPQLEDFETYSEFNKAYIKWELKQAKLTEQQESQQAQARAEAEKVQTTFNERVQTFAEKHSDFQERLNEAWAASQASMYVDELITNSEDGPALLYALTEDVDVWERINSLSGLQAAREIGKFESRLAKASEAAPKPTIPKTKAPPPISPVNAKAPASSQKSPDDMDPDEFMEWRRDQARRGRS